MQVELPGDLRNLPRDRPHRGNGFANPRAGQYDQEHPFHPGRFIHLQLRHLYPGRFGQRWHDSGNTVGSANVAERYEISGDSYAIRAVSTSSVNLSNNLINNFHRARGSDRRVLLRYLARRRRWHSPRHQ